MGIKRTSASDLSRGIVSDQRQSAVDELSLKGVTVADNVYITNKRILEKRPGTNFIHAFETGKEALYFKSFPYGGNREFVIAICNGGIRIYKKNYGKSLQFLVQYFYTDDGLTPEAKEILTAFTRPEVRDTFDLKASQLGDITLFTSPNFRPFKLTRILDLEWRFEFFLGKVLQVDGTINDKFDFSHILITEEEDVVEIEDEEDKKRPADNNITNLIHNQAYLIVAPTQTVQKPHGNSYTKDFISSDFTITKPAGEEPVTGVVKFMAKYVRDMWLPVSGSLVNGLTTQINQMARAAGIDSLTGKMVHSPKYAIGINGHNNIVNLFVVAPSGGFCTTFPSGPLNMPKDSPIGFRFNWHQASAFRDNRRKRYFNVVDILGSATSPNESLAKEAHVYYGYTKIKSITLFEVTASNYYNRPDGAAYFKNGLHVSSVRPISTVSGLNLYVGAITAASGCSYFYDVEKRDGFLPLDGAGVTEWVTAGKNSVRYTKNRDASYTITSSPPCYYVGSPFWVDNTIWKYQTETGITTGAVPRTRIAPETTVSSSYAYNITNQIISEGTKIQMLNLAKSKYRIPIDMSFPFSDVFSIVGDPNAETPPKLGGGSPDLWLSRSSSYWFHGMKAIPYSSMVSVDLQNATFHELVPQPLSIPDTISIFWTGNVKTGFPQETKGY